MASVGACDRHKLIFDEDSGIKRYERCRVTVVAKTEMNNVQRRRKLGGVPLGGGFEVGRIDRHRMCERRHSIEQRFGESRQVAIGASRRSHSLVDLEHIDRRPADWCLAQSLEHRPRRATPRHGNRGATAKRHSGFEFLDNDVGCNVGQVGAGSQNADHDLQGILRDGTVGGCFTPDSVPNRRSRQQTGE